MDITDIVIWTDSDAAKDRQMCIFVDVEEQMAYSCPECGTTGFIEFRLRFDTMNLLTADYICGKGHEGTINVFAMELKEAKAGD